MTFWGGGFYGGGFGYIGGGETPEPPEILFCVNTLPPHPNAIYRWLDDAIWDDSNYWID